MAVSIKTELLVDTDCMKLSSPLTVGVNAMDDEKQQNFLQQAMLKKERQLSSKDDQTRGHLGKGDQKVSDSHFQTLMEYREAPSSPGASSVHSLNMEHLGSPTPSPPPLAPVEMDDDRLPNELLDEICEDIGMKEGGDLDFVEFLMEQDMVDPQVYMTPEAIRNTLASSVPSASTGPPIASKTATTAGRSLESNGRSCSSPATTYSQASSSGCNVAPSSGSSSPAAKRFHVSTSGPTSPVRSDPPKLFKAPQTPPTPRRPSSQCIASPSISSTQGPQHSPLPRSQSPCSSSSVPQSPVQKQHPSFSQSSSNTMFNYNIPQKGGVSSSSACSSSSQYPRQNNGCQGYQRRPPAPNVNVQNMQQHPPYNMQQQQQQQKWGMGQVPQVPQGGSMSCSMNSMHSRPGGYPNHAGHTQQYSRPLESPLDGGYYSGDAGSVRSLASTVPSSLSSMPSTNTAVPNHSMHIRHGPPTGPNSGQKSVHFADLPSVDSSVPLQRQPSNDGMASYGHQSYDPNLNPDCDLDGEFRDPNHRGVPSKILPRLNSVKVETAPYTVPNGQAMSPYNDYGRNSRPGSGDMVQQYEYPPQQKPGDMFNVDSNQNSLNMNNCNNGMQGREMSSCTGGMPMGMQSHPGPYDNNMQPQGPQAVYQGPNSMQDGQYKQQQNCSMQNNLSSYCDNNQCRTMNPGQKMNGMPYPGQMGPQNMPQQGPMMGGDCAQGNYPMQNNYMQGADNSQCSPMPHQSVMHNGVPPDFDHMPNGNMYPGNPNGQNMGPQVAWNSANPGNPQPSMGMTPKMPQHQGGMPSMGGNPGQNPLQPGTPQVHCSTPNCQSCKTGSPHRPKMMQSQQVFIQHIITDNSSAFRSHPLFPLLRDLCIADMNFASPSFPYQLISNLPADFDKLLQNFLHRNPPSGNYQTNYSVESVVMEALHFAHGSLIEKIRARQEQDKLTKTTSKSLREIEEFCEKFDKSVRQTIIKPATFQVPNQGNAVSSSSMGVQGMGNMMGPNMGTPTKGMPHMMMGDMYSSPMGKKCLDMNMMSSPQFKHLKDLPDCSDGGSLVTSSSSHNMKSESKKHPSLPKEAVAFMLDWLRQHKDNPYPNDDEKAMLIKQTGLTINQINYWFTNARRRILPKWAQQCKT